MDTIKHLLDFLLHIDSALKGIIVDYGAWTYGILFFIIFIETGFVVTPFLPGDSLIFAAATFARDPDYGLNIWFLFALLSGAAVLGDTVNYWIGHYLGDRAYNIRWIKKEYLDKTHAFFEKHGGKTIFLARFVPIVRTFAPFVAGIGRMSYGFFFRWNVIGGISWVALFCTLGFLFGGIPFVQQHFKLTVVIIILISVVPIGVEWFKARREKMQEASA